MSLTDGGEKVHMEKTADIGNFNEIWNESDEPETTTAEPAGEATPAPAVEARTGEEPAPDGGANTAAPPAPLTREDGATWSEKASRWYKDGKIVAGEPPVTEPKVEQAPEAVTPAPVAEVPKVETPIAEPFRVRANGQKFEFPGLVVPPEMSEQIRGLIVDGLNHRQNFTRVQTEWKQKLAQAEQMVEARSSKYNKASVYLFDKISQLLAEQPQELEMTRRELALMLKEADLTIPAQQPQAAPEVDQQALEQGARATLAGYLQELLEDTPGASILSTEDKKDLADAFQARLAAYFEEQNGEIMLDTHAAKRDFDRELKIAQRAHQVREQAARDAEKLKAAASFNAATNATPAPRPAARPKPALAAAPSGTPAKGFDQAFKDAWNNDDDE